MQNVSGTGGVWSQCGGLVKGTPTECEWQRVRVEKVGQWREGACAECGLHRRRREEDFPLPAVLLFRKKRARALDQG